MAGSCGGVTVKHPWPLLEISLSDLRRLATLNINTYLPTKTIDFPGNLVLKKSSTLFKKSDTALGQNPQVHGTSIMESTGYPKLDKNSLTLTRLAHEQNFTGVQVNGIVHISYKFLNP